MNVQHKLVYGGAQTMNTKETSFCLVFYKKFQYNIFSLEFNT